LVLLFWRVLSWQRLRSKDARPEPKKQVHTSSGSREKIPAKRKKQRSRGTGRKRLGDDLD